MKTAVPLERPEDRGSRFDVVPFNRHETTKTRKALMVSLSWFRGFMVIVPVRVCRGAVACACLSSHALARFGRIPGRSRSTTYELVGADLSPVAHNPLMRTEQEVFETLLRGFTSGARSTFGTGSGRTCRCSRRRVRPSSRASISRGRCSRKVETRHASRLRRCPPPSLPSRSVRPRDRQP